jgi:hypothetical protein
MILAEGKGGFSPRFYPWVGNFNAVCPKGTLFGVYKLNADIRDVRQPISDAAFRAPRFGML